MAPRRRRRSVISGRQAPFDMVLTVVKYVISVILVLFFITRAREAYELGYSIFQESSLDPVGQGQSATITTTAEMSEKDISKLLQKSGLIKSAFVFQVQLRFSDYEGKLQPGTYTLSSDMLPSEIMKEMAGASGESDASAGQSSPSAASASDISEAAESSETTSTAAASADAVETGTGTADNE